MHIVLAALTLVALASPAVAHSWYSQTVDPKWGGSCCGGADCAEVPPEWWTKGYIGTNDDGYWLNIPASEAQRINPATLNPINAVVPWNRAQPSRDGNFHMCAFQNDRSGPRGGVICFFVPPDT